MVNTRTQRDSNWLKWEDRVRVGPQNREISKKGVPFATNPNWNVTQKGTLEAMSTTEMDSENPVKFENLQMVTNPAPKE